MKCQGLSYQSVNNLPTIYWILIIKDRLTYSVALKGFCFKSSSKDLSEGHKLIFNIGYYGNGY